ncbi:glycosyltransferase family 9 protein [Sodalis ligni]|uniref:glycosyltransferase family 9 protein n=1 Tax=Sodalis ligni TaxID=2697027 RepID=UPI00193FFAD4|nr:glycosyltransferase family 9 protein [Sodalis ligni]QWA10627.1 glycosyltransferase family 9 protein [Sodalis ligni]
MKALVVCRDNIGDTLLTTPLINALANGGFSVDVLANSYNAAVLTGNPDIFRVHVYKKNHHRARGESLLKILLHRLRIIWNIRRIHYDIAIIAKSRWDKRVLKWCTLSGAPKIIALGAVPHPAITELVPLPAPHTEHLVQLFHRMLAPLGIRDAAGPLHLFADPAKVAALAQQYGIDNQLPILGLQISARRLLQRWPESHFVALAQMVAALGPCQIILLWSPGAEDNPTHPGDDTLAARIVAACNLPCLIPIPTRTLEELIGAMQLCGRVVTSDGGAMHIAAGLGKSIVALFGDSDPVCWAPWQVPYILLAAPENNVVNIAPKEVFQALQQLTEEDEVAAIRPSDSVAVKDG